jgi:hypothetical protein
MSTMYVVQGVDSARISQLSYLVFQGRTHLVASLSRNRSPSSVPPRPPGSASSPRSRRSRCMPTRLSTRWRTPASGPPTSTARDRQRDAGDGRALSGPDPEMGLRHRGRGPRGCPARAGRPGIVHDPCPPRRRSIASGLCETVLITHVESGRSGGGRTRNVVAPTSLAGQFEQPDGPMGAPKLLTMPVLRYRTV